MADPIHIEVKGADILAANLDKFSKEIASGLKGAGEEAGHEIIQTEGLAKYPPMTEANSPPPPYYIRGRGTQYMHRNAGNSERYDTQFIVKHEAGKGTVIGNRASYAKWLAGEQQARHMAKIGWRKLLDVAKEKLGTITKIYQGWVDKIIRDLKL
jgi:hypothetical protein